MNKIVMLDCSLPERSKVGITSLLEVNAMPVRIPEGEEWQFNCWGFTAYYLGWEQKGYWMRAEVMENFLETRATFISASEVQAGDVAVFRNDDGYLTHTAILMPDPLVVCHKPGANPLCIDTLDAARRSYGDVSYMRPAKKSEKDLVAA